MSLLLRIVLAIGLGRFLWSRSTPRVKDSPLDSDSQPWFEWTNDLKFEWYIQRRNGYSSGARDSYSRYDQTIAGVSAGAIVLSLTFLKDLDYAPESLPLLYASWIVFLISGGCSLYSLRTSADCDIENLSQLEQLRKTGKLNNEKAKKLGEKTVTLNRISLIAVLSGIFLIMLFAFANYSVLEEKTWRQKEKAVPENLTRPAESAEPQQRRRSQPPLNQLPEPAGPGSTSPKDSPATPSNPQTRT